MVKLLEEYWSHLNIKDHLWVVDNKDGMEVNKDGDNHLNKDGVKDHHNKEDGVKDHHNKDGANLPNSLDGDSHHNKVDGDNNLHSKADGDNKDLLQTKADGDSKDLLQTKVDGVVTIMDGDSIFVMNL